MAVQHVGLQLRHQLAEAQPHQYIRRPRLAVNGDAVHAESKARGDFRERRVGSFAAGEAVGDDPDLVAAVGLAVGEVDDVTENAAHWRAHRVQDAEGLIWRGHDQNQRSAARAPGM